MAHRKKHNVRLLRRDYSYSIPELTELFGVHANTIGQWRKRGLRAIDDRRPPLFHGSDLIEFLTRAQSVRKRTCAPDEFYCCHCRAARQAWEGVADLVILDDRRVLLKAVCCECEGAMNRLGTVANISKYETIFEIQKVTDRRLNQ